MFELYILLLLFCLLVYSINRKELPYSFRYIAILLLITTGSEWSKYYMFREDHLKNAINHLYQPVEFLLLTAVYYHAYSRSLFRRIVKTIVPFYLVFTAIASVFIEGIYEKNLCSFLLGSFLMVLFSILYMLELFGNPTYNNPLKIPFFWISTGIMFYCAGTFFQMGLLDYFEKRQSGLTGSLVLTGHVLNYFLYSSFLTGFIWKKPKSSS